MMLLPESEKNMIKYEIISDAGKIAMFLPDLYIAPKKVFPIYDKLSNRILLNIQEFKEQVVKSVV